MPTAPRSSTNAHSAAIRLTTSSGVKIGAILPPRDAVGFDLNPPPANHGVIWSRVVQLDNTTTPLRRAWPRPKRRRVRPSFLAQQHCMGDACCDSRKRDTISIRTRESANCLRGIDHEI